jgi:hypothetical protein
MFFKKEENNKNAQKRKSVFEKEASYKILFKK